MPALSYLLPATRLAALSRCSARTITVAGHLRSYGGAHGKTFNDPGHGGNTSPTSRNVGETGSSGPNESDVAQSRGAFSKDPNPESSAKAINKDLPEGDTMDNSASNADMSTQFKQGDKAVPDSTSSDRNKADHDSRRSKRSTGRGV